MQPDDIQIVKAWNQLNPDSRVKHIADLSEEQLESLEKELAGIHARLALLHRIRNSLPVH